MLVKPRQEQPDEVGDGRGAHARGGIYKNVIMHYAKVAEVPLESVCVHAMRSTADTNALARQSDIAKVQAWLGHASIATTRLYDRRDSRPEDSPTFRVNY